jgi:hypothetical protein
MGFPQGQEQPVFSQALPDQVERFVQGDEMAGRNEQRPAALARPQYPTNLISLPVERGNTSYFQI